MIKLLQVLFCFILAIFLSACASNQNAELPIPDIRIGLAPLNQPTDSSELMAGYFPKDRRLADENQIQNLDSAIKEKIALLPRQIMNLVEVNDELLAPFIEENPTKGVLAYWIEYGKYQDVDLILVPQLYYYHDKEASNKQGMENALMLDFYLIDTRDNGLLLARSHFAEEEQATQGNILGMIAFTKRIGDSSINAMLSDSIDRMVEEFNL